MIAAVPPKQWRRISAGDGAHGEREYFWVRIPIFDRLGARARALAPRPPIPVGSDRDRVLHLRRTPPYHAHRTSPPSRGRGGGSNASYQARSDAGPDQYQVRTARAWYAHTTLSMLTLAWLAGTKSHAVKGDSVSTVKADRLHGTGRSGGCSCI